MSKDFRTNQIRTIKLIGSGGIDPTRPYLGLMFYSSSAADNYDGDVESNMLADVGNDVWLFVSGAADHTAYVATQKPSGGSVLFGGDVVISGTLYAERQIIEVDASVDGDLIVPNALAAGVKDMSPGGGNYAKLLVDPTTENYGKIGAQAQQKVGTVSFNITNSPGPGAAWSYNGNAKHDVFFHVSGSRGVRGTNQRGLALFDGDIHTSGNFSLSPESVITTDIILDNGTNDPPIFAQQNGFGNRWTEIAVQNTGDPNKFDVELANSGSDIDSGLKFKVRAGTVPGEKAVMLSGSGKFSIVRDAGLELDSALGVNLSFETAGGGLSLKLESNPALAASHNRSFEITQFGVSASNGIFFPQASSAISAWGQQLGIMFAGSSNTGVAPWRGSPGNAGIFYNSQEAPAGSRKNPHFSDVGTSNPPNALVITSSATAHKINIGAAKVELWAAEQGILLAASDPARTDPHGGPLQLYATGSGIEMWGDVTMRNSLEIDGNLTVWGDKIIGHVITASIQDPVLLLNSGARPEPPGAPSNNMNPSGGGIAIASGSSFNNQAMVFGRFTGNNTLPDKNTFFAGRLDVEDGLVTNFIGAEPIRMLASGFRLPPNITTPSLDTQCLITGSGGVTVLSGSRWALESGNQWFFNDIGTKTGPAPAGAYYMVYENEGVSPIPDLHLHIGTGSFTIAADTNSESSLFLGSSGRTLWKDDAGDGETKFLTDRKLIISSSNGLVLSTSNQELVISASSTALPQPPVKIFGGDVRIATTDTTGGIEIIANWDVALSASNDDGKVVITAGPNAGYNGGELSSAQLFLSGGIVDALGYGGEIGAAFINTPFLESQYIIETYPDVNFFVSGSIDSRQSTHRGTSVFGGDLVVSGTAKVGALAIDNLVLEGEATNQPFIRFGLPVDSPKIYEDDYNNLAFFDDQIVSPGYTLTQLAARGVELNDNVWKVTYAGGGGDYGSYIATSGSVSFDFDQNWTGTPDPYVPKRTNNVGFGGEDVFFIVSGSKGGKSAGHERSTSVFRGDLLTSGAMYWARISTAMAAAQVVGDDAVSVYAKDVAGETRLFYRNSVIELPLGAGGSLDDSYDTPPGGGLKSDGAGAIIDVDNRPVQLDGDPTTAGIQKVVLAASGSINLVDPSGGTTPPHIMSYTTNSDLDFKVTLVGPTPTKVFSLTGGSANLLVANSRRIAFHPSETEAILQYQNDNVNGIAHGVGSKHFLPVADDTYDLGSPGYRWANVYTGDLHLKNDRGSWTILEERDYLCVVNNLTGKKYKMALEPLEDDE